MLRNVWKFRILIVIAALVLVAGGAVAFAASEGALSSNSPSGTSAGASQNNEGHNGNNGNTEPTAVKNTEPTATKGTEPTPVPHTLMKGKITSVDCAGGTITIAVDNNGGSFTAQITTTTHMTVSGQASACSGLKVGWHVTIEANQVNGQWVASGIAQDDSGQPGNGGGDGGATPTPGANH
jgi:hypothetical protein